MISTAIISIRNQNLIMNFEYMNLIDLKFINYQKPETKVSDISINLTKNKDIVKIKEIKCVENKNSFLVKDIRFKKK